MISLLDVSFECNFITIKVSGSLLQNFLTSWAKFTLQLSRHMAGSKKFSQASLSAHGGRNLDHLIISCFSHCISHCFNFFLNIVGRRNRAFLPDYTCAVPGAYTACLAGCRFWAHPQLLSLSQILLTDPKLTAAGTGSQGEVQAVLISLLHNWEDTWELIRCE